MTVSKCRARMGFNLALALLAAGGSGAAEVSFLKEIAPVFAQKCLTCHGPEKFKGSYQLHTFELLLKAGSSKTPPILPGNVAKSELFRLLTTLDADDRMPQKDDPLPAATIRLIEQWIQQGAKFDGNDPKAPLASLIPRRPHPPAPVAYARPVPITALAFSPDGRQLVASGYHEVTFWDAESGQLIRRVGNLPQRVQALAWQPGGASLAVAGGSPGRSGEVALLDTASGEITKVLGTTTDTVLAVAFSPDGRMLATGGADNSIRVYELPGGRELRAIQQHADWVMGLAFSPDGQHLASASRDRTARVFTVATGELETSHQGHNAPVSAVAFAPDGKSIFTCGKDKEIHQWQAKDARKLGEVRVAEGEPLRFAGAANFLFSGGADRLVRQIKTEDRSVIRTFSGLTDQTDAIAAHPGTQRVAAGAHNGEVRVWKWEDGQLAVHFIAAPGYQPAATATRR